MQLRSPDGATVDLRITGYQFPDYKVPAAEAAGTWLRAVTMASRLPGANARHLARDWDANWLQVRGDITLADGKTWAFEDPCLTTWQARELGSWLREAAAGTVPPSRVAGGEPGELLEFLEPDIAFSMQGRADGRVRIRVYFSLEALPPWLQGTAEEPGLFEYFVRLDVSADELTRAAESWLLDLAEFPPR